MNSTPKQGLEINFEIMILAMLASEIDLGKLNFPLKPQDPCDKEGFRQCFEETVARIKSYFVEMFPAVTSDDKCNPETVNECLMKKFGEYESKGILEEFRSGFHVHYETLRGHMAWIERTGKDEKAKVDMLRSYSNNHGMNGVIVVLDEGDKINII